MQKLIWQNSLGDEIDLTKSPYGITNWEGFSNTSLNIQSQQVPFQDGGVFLDALMEQRELEVTLAMQDENNLENRYRMRRELIHILNPKLGEGYLIYTNDFTSKRIKCVAQIPLFETHNSNDSGTPKASLAWTACEPYWEDLEETTVELELDSTAHIKNNGEVDVGFKLDFFQANGVEFPKITNITENKVIEYNGQLEKNLKINTESGRKTVNTQDFDFNVIARNITMYSSCKGRGLYIVGGQRGIILTSEDGETWESQESKVDYAIYSIVYAKKQGVYLYAGTKIGKSLDGKNWEKTDTNAKFLFYDEDSGYVYAITSSSISRSFNLEDWVEVFNVEGTSITSLDGNLLKDENGLYNLSGSYKVTSSDGVTWNYESTSGGTSVGSNKKVLYRNGKYIEIGFNSILTSSDGTNYVKQTFSNYDFRDIVYWDKINKYVISSRNKNLLISDDAETWSDSTNVYGFTLLADDNKMFVFNNIVYKFSDISNYERVYNSISKIICSCPGLKSNIILGGGTASPISGKIYKLNKNDDFEEVLNLNNQVNDLCKIKNYLLSCCSGNLILKSYNEETWVEKQSITSSIMLNSIAFSEEKNIIIIGGTDGTILRSVDDGETWESQESGTSYSITSVLYVKKYNKFFAFAGSLVLSSENGVTWNLISNMETPINKVCYSNELGVFVGVGYYGNYNGCICRSLDAVNWEFITSTSFPLISVTYNSEYGCFFASGINGYVYMSPDGLSWKNLYTFGESGDLNTIIFDSSLDKILFAGAVFVNEIQREKENVINNLTNNSDLNMKLLVGNNDLYISCLDGTFNARIKYRQKYIGV